MADEEGSCTASKSKPTSKSKSKPKSKSKSNPNQNQNQAPDQNLPPNQNPPPPLYPFMQNAPIVPEAPQRLQLNWSHFKLEYAGRPDEDAEVHLLRTNDWMDTHKFPEQVKVQRFCLTLVGEARL